MDTLKQSKVFYNKNAKSFSTSRAFNWSEIAELCQEVPSGSRVLDVGCGNGRLLESFKNKKIEYIGVDNSKGLLAEARRKYPQSNFILGDILELDRIAELKNKSFDYIFCLAVLHHLPTKECHQQAVQQINKLTSDKTRVVISVWDIYKKRYSKYIVQRFWSNVKIIPWRAEGKNEPRYIYGFKEKYLRKLLPGFKVNKKGGNILAIKR